ncbi:MAG: hypothetical protein KFF49_01610 [Bacteroidales bacterium]|nr:hypothetical protein [Bacteroidales bacterium]
MKKRIQIAALLAGMILVSSGVSAQHIQTQYFMNIPQASQLNPAFRPNANVFIALPVLSGTYVGMSNNLLNVTNLFQPMPGTDSIMTILHPDYDRDRFFRNMGNKAFVSTELSTPILGVGFTVANDWWLDFGITAKAMAHARLPADFFILALEGNEEFLGSRADLSGMGFKAQAFLETHIGLSKNFTKRLRIGGRLKFMQGALSASLMADNLELQVNDDYSHTLNTDVALKLNGPFDVSLDEDGFIDDILFREEVAFRDLGPSFKNFGMGIDAGAEYRLLDNLQLSASIIDLGFIRWGRESYTFRATNNFTFDGFDISEVITGDKEFDQVIEELGDSLLTTFEFVESDEGFTMGLPTKLYLAASYQPVQFLSLGILSRTTLGMGVRESLTLSATLFAGDILSTSLSYTMTNRSFNNLGFGLGVRGGPFQFYTVVDQIPLGWVEFAEEGSSERIVIPQRLDYINVRFGINLLFGRVKQQKTDTPMLID